MLNKSAVLILLTGNLLLIYGFKISNISEDDDLIENAENDILQLNKSNQSSDDSDDIKKKLISSSRIDALELQYYQNNFYKIADEFKRNHYEKHQIKSEDIEDEETEQLGSWSVIWYVASFGGLIAFFLVVSCSEWCCRRNIRNNCSRNSPLPTHNISDTPPPSYDQFAPPPYESLCYNRNGEKSEFDVYVVPVHTFGTIMENNSLQEDAPPSYLSAAAMCSNLNGEVPERTTSPVVADCIKDQNIPT